MQQSSRPGSKSQATGPGKKRFFRSSPNNFQSVCSKSVPSPVMALRVLAARTLVRGASHASPFCQRTAPCMTALPRPAAHATCSHRQFHASSVTSEKKRDYYDVLGLKKGSASASEIKKAYFQMAKKFVPLFSCSDPTNQRQVAFSFADPTPPR